METILEKITKDPRIVEGIKYGKPRRGHSEGTVEAHITELEKNLDTLLNEGHVGEYYDQLKILIWVHDSFKGVAKRDSAIMDLQSHASLARAFLAEFTDDHDMLQIVQQHDLGYAIYKKFKDSGQLDTNRLWEGTTGIGHIDLYMLFCIIDGCTGSKGREMIRWFHGELSKLRPDMLVSAACIDLMPAGELDEGIF